MTSISTIGTGLTHKVRSLVVIIIIIIMLLCYITCGSLVQTFMLDITFVNFSVVSIETIGEHETLGDTNFIVSFYLFAVNTGFGEIRPTNTGSRIFVSLYISGGILNLTLAVAFS